MNAWIERNRVFVVAALVVVDLITLIVSVVIALNQHAAIDKANDAATAAKHAARQSQHAVNEVKVRVCRNSEALIKTNKRQIAGYNRQIEITTVPYVISVLHVDHMAAKSIVDQSLAQFNQSKASAYRAIRDLSRNCA